MHTSQALRSSHFEYRRPGADGRVAFSAFCADYHDQDRVAVVSPCLEDGILHTAYALLALTTAFYDVQRANGGDFFIYPQHFAIIGEHPPGAVPARHPNSLDDKIGIATGAGPLDLTLDEAGIGGAWSWLDVWPASNWFTAPVTPVAMLRKAFDLHINRLFWPQDFIPRHQKDRNSVSEESPDTLLRSYARRMLRTRLKSVYYYNSHTPTVEILPAQPAVDLAQASMVRLPQAVRQSLETVSPLAETQRHQSFRQVAVDDFLADMEPCFES